MPGRPDRPYEVVFSGVQTARARALGEVASRRGLLESFLAALHTVMERLAVDPLEWGDPYARLAQLDLVLFHRSWPPLNIFYAVDPSRRIVYVRDIALLPGCGLDLTE